MNMEDGGLCGGRAPTALYSPRRLFYTTSTQICTPTRCHRRSRITLCGKGTNSTRSFLHFLQLVNCSRHIFLILHRNCEDIAMSFLVANTTGSPPIWVQGKLIKRSACFPSYRQTLHLAVYNHQVNIHVYNDDRCLSPPIGNVYETGSSSISSLQRTPDRRNKCLNDLISLYGTLPLVHTHLKAVDSRYELFWQILKNSPACLALQKDLVLRCYLPVCNDSFPIHSSRYIQLIGIEISSEKILKKLQN